LKKSFLILISLFLLNSCSPLYSLYVQNNSQNPIEIFVELKDWKYNKNFKKEFEKRKLYYYKSNANAKIYEETLIDWKFLQANKVSEKKYNFTSDFEYHFTIEPNLLTNIDPNNSLSIYPFKEIYYIQNGKKCFIAPKEKINCSVNVNHQEILKKNNRAKWLIDFIEIEN